MLATPHRKTILWADDDPDDLLFIQEAMKELPYDVSIIEASNGHDVLQYLHRLTPSQYPCLIVLDINMPLLNGKETLSQLRSEDRYAAIAVVLFSTSGSEADRHFCRQHNAEIILKPSRFTELKKVVESLLQRCFYSGN